MYNIVKYTATTSYVMVVVETLEKAQSYLKNIAGLYGRTSDAVILSNDDRHLQVGNSGDQILTFEIVS